MQQICLGCKIAWLRYFVLGFTVIISLFFGVPAIALFYVHIKNYANGQTTNERLAKKPRASSIVTDEDSLIDNDDGAEDTAQGQNGRRRGKRGCCGNCWVMCCNRNIRS